MKPNLLAFAALIMAAAMNSCVDVPKEQHTSYETIKVQRNDFDSQLKYSAVIIGKSDVQITPQVSGQIVSKHVVPGQVVKAGQTLFVIDSREAQIEVQNAQSVLLAAEAQVATAKLEMESNENLFKKEIVSEYMVTSARNAYKRATAGVAQAKAALNAAKLNLSHCTITSPVNGIVGNLQVELGQVVAPGTLMATVSENADVRVHFSLSENDMLDLTRSLECTPQEFMAKLPDVSLVLKDGFEYPYSGRILNYTGNVDTNTGTVTVEAQFPNPDGMLSSGAQGTIVIPTRMKSVIVIPNTAVVRLQDKSIVYKVGKDSCAASTIVELVEANGKEFVVTKGLNPGDVILKTGVSNVQEKQRVIF